MLKIKREIMLGKATVLRKDCVSYAEKKKSKNEWRVQNDKALWSTLAVAAGMGGRDGELGDGCYMIKRFLWSDVRPTQSRQEGHSWNVMGRGGGL